MDELSYKVRISVLWLLHLIAFFAYRTLALSEGFLTCLRGLGRIGKSDQLGLGGLWPRLSPR